MNRKTIITSVLLGLLLLSSMLLVGKYSIEVARKGDEDLKIAILSAINNQFALLDEKEINQTKLEEGLTKLSMSNPAFINNLFRVEKTTDVTQKQTLLSHEKPVQDNVWKDPTLGNASASIKILDFFDYGCLFCKKMHETNNKILESNQDVQFVIKVVAVTGANSTKAAKFALFANMIEPSKYHTLHDLLMKFDGPITDENLLALAQQAGIDTVNLNRVMSDPTAITKVETELQNNFKLGNSIGLRGVPAYMIGEKVVSGTVSYNDLKLLIDQERHLQATPVQVDVQTPASTLLKELKEEIGDSK